MLTSRAEKDIPSARHRAGVELESLQEELVRLVGQAVSILDAPGIDPNERGYAESYWLYQLRDLAGMISGSSDDHLSAHIDAMLTTFEDREG